MQNGRVSCQFGERRARKGHTRKVLQIDAPGVCDHLQILCGHEQLWNPPSGPVREPAIHDEELASSDSEIENEIPTDEPHGADENSNKVHNTVKYRYKAVMYFAIF